MTEELKVKEEVVSLLHAYPHFGREKTKVIANVYESKEALDFVVWFPRSKTTVLKWCK